MNFIFKQKVLTAFSDIKDWACNPDYRQSILACLVFLGNSLILRACRKQKVVARSIIEAEYNALAHATLELSWIQSILKEIRLLHNSPLVIWCDNTITLSLAINSIFRSRSKLLGPQFYTLISGGEKKGRHLRVETKIRRVLNQQYVGPHEGC